MGPRRVLFALALGLIARNIALECVRDRSLLATALAQSVVCIAQSQLAGTGAAPAVLILVRLKLWQQIYLRSASRARGHSVMFRL